MTPPPTPSRQSLATGFRDVDHSGDTAACHRCLDLLARIPFFRQIKDESFRIIGEADPERVLDAGCGAGADLVSLLRHLQGRSQVIGLDASGALLARASELTGTYRDRCSLIRGDIANIPCRENVFDACRIDRVLQHLHDPEAGVRELLRVMKPCGTLVAFDNDWETFSLSLDDPEIAGRIRRSWHDSFASGRAGRDLPGIFDACGLTAIHAEQRPLQLTSLSIAEQVFDLHNLLEQMVQKGVITPAETAAVWEELLRRARKGTFSSGYTGYLVRGTKPG